MMRWLLEVMRSVRQGPPREMLTWPVLVAYGTLTLSLALAIALVLSGDYEAAGVFAFFAVVSAAVWIRLIYGRWT